MTPFLQHIARDLYERRLKNASPDELMHLRLVFPSRRARLYFTHFMADIIEQPLWMPASDNIDGLFSRISGLREANRYAVVAEIFRCYKQVLAEMAVERKLTDTRGIDESFEQFYYWGELMLRDFDALDRYLVKVDPLLRNVSDLKKLTSDDLSFLSPEQIRVLEQFWTHVDTNRRLPANFCEFWDTLKPTYDRLHTVLKARGEGYAGMICREAINSLDSYDFGLDRFVFIGFGALSRCEERLFTRMGGISEFYWDYDRYYRDSEIQEAGLFVRQNAARFRAADAELPAGNTVYDSFGRAKDISIIDAPSELMQAKILPMLLNDFNDSSSDDAFPPRTAIVLANENLLVPVLYSLGETGGQAVNITMGYPLAQTSAFSLMHFAIALQRNVRGTADKPRFYHKDVLALLNHDYIHALAGEHADALCQAIVARNLAYIAPEQLAELSGQASAEPAIGLLLRLFACFTDYTVFFALLKEVLEAVGEAFAASVADDDTDSGDDATTADRMSDLDLQRSAIAFCMKNMNLLEDALALCGDVEMPVVMAGSLLLAALRNERIPFEGEPVSGLQVMGILDTHLLDFENVIILSLNDDFFPTAVNVPSLLPYNLRRAYGLPSIEEAEALSAYAFYRLLQRAEHVRLVYNSGGGEQRTGEMSRYLRQLMLESPHRNYIAQRSWSASFGNLPANRRHDRKVEKTGTVGKALEDYLNDKRTLSPSSLKNFMSCPLKFYYSNVLGLADDAEVDEGADAVLLGNAFHHTMEELYLPLKGTTVVRKDIEALLAGRARLEERVVFHTARVLINRNDPALSHVPTATDLRNVRESGELALVTAVVLKYVEAMLRYDMKQTPFTLRGIEQEVDHLLAFADADGRIRSVRLHGIIDRLDVKDDAAKVIDYKTGNYINKRRADSLDSLFASQFARQRHEIFQTMLYSLVKHQTGDCDGLRLVPSLYFLRELSQEQSRGETDITIAGNAVSDARTLLPHFTESLQTLLSRMFDFAQPFTMTEDEKHCEHCDFRELCGR